MTSTLSEYGHRNKTLWILIIAVSVLGNASFTRCFLFWICFLNARLCQTDA